MSYLAAPKLKESYRKHMNGMMMNIILENKNYIQQA